MRSLFARFLRERCKPILQRERLYDTMALEHIDYRAGRKGVFERTPCVTARLGEGNTGGTPVVPLGGIKIGDSPVS
jgi:hypothetical protein